MEPGQQEEEPTTSVASPKAANGPINITSLPVGSIITTDGVKLQYETYGHSGSPVVFIHGWSASRHYFDLNTRPIARHSRVITYDQRYHGDSGKPAWGFHVSRLAADLHELLTHLDLDTVTLIGCSMGAAVIWSYIELFGEGRLAGAVFVDQAPLQNVAADWKCGSTGCYDIASLTRLQSKLESDFAGFAADNVKFCTSIPLGDEVVKVLEGETLKSDPYALGQLMADHTALDWRPLLKRIQIPCLNLVGRRSAVFPWWGPEAVGKLVPNCHTVFFEDANHWLYLEEPTKFNNVVNVFIKDGLMGVNRIIRL